MLKKYALVKNGIVQSTFYSAENPNAFPDIEPYLHEVPEEVRDNWAYVAGVFIEPYDPADEVQDQVAEIKPWWKFWA